MTAHAPTQSDAPTPYVRPGRLRRLVPSVGFLRFLLRRFVAMVLLLVGITLVTFCLTNLVPGDPAALAVGPAAESNPALIPIYRHKFGLDKPLPEQYILYMKHLVQGDLGMSHLSDRPVTDDLRQYAPATAEIAFFACLVGFTIGIALGTWAALRRESLADHSLRIISLAGLSAPPFWLALVVLYFLFFKWGIAPGGGRLSPGATVPPHTTGAYTLDSLIHGKWGTFWDALQHLMLPVIVLGLVVVGYVTRYTRSAVLEVASEDYVRAARAKGLPELTVITRYILRGAAPSVITVLGLAFAYVLAGSIFIEAVYGFAGLGLYAFKSSVGLDLPAITGVCLFIASVYIIINFIIDVLYGLIDPQDQVDVTTQELTVGVAAPVTRSRSRRKRIASFARHRPLAVIGGTLIVAWLIVSILAPVIAPYNPLAQDSTALQSPSSAHLFGTDELGRDVFSRVLYGARVSIPVAILLIALSLVIGITLGVIAGYFRGWVDGGVMRLTDLVFAFPAIILALVVTASLGKGLQNAVFALVIVSWPAYARVTRGLVLSIGDSDYVKSARLLGASSRRTIVRDVVPNFIGPLIVLAMLDLGGAILLLAGLSFLGLGAQPPTAEWGLMVSEGVGYFQFWWMATFPGLAIFTAVLAFNFVGDSLRDIFDPRSVGTRR